MTIEKSSFRDNDGFIFYEHDEIFRAIAYSYKENYEHLIKSGLYDYLIKENLLISHSEDESNDKLNTHIFKIIKPQKVDFISYPYEWCFSQLKDAALTTLRIQKIALKYGMSLKDSSAYNIQFYRGKAVLIDTLSFEIYKENEPWIAYNQFCKNFLAPLALAALCDVRLNLMLKNFIDGIPLDIAKNILRKKALLSLGIFIHIYLHSYFQIKYSDKDKPVSVNKKRMNKNSHLRLIGNLETTIDKLRIKRNKTNWSDYYQLHNQTYFNEKKEIVKNYIKSVNPKRVLDAGANDGEFSKMASANSDVVIAFDSDHYCIEKCYNHVKKNDIQNLIPLVVDLANPSPSIGWANSERISLIERSNADLVLALAIIHHLCISNNVPLGFAAEFFSKICKWLIIEFVPKRDPMVKKLLLHRKDIFENYTVESFENEFLKYFSLIDRKNVSGTDRIIYLMKNNNGIGV
ncbi:MAG: SAM-dependent methyltransferase [Ignavibacteria bacterium]|nr:SAM-dependent methyltransferase [Ignavibacteria bacterium]